MEEARGVYDIITGTKLETEETETKEKIELFEEPKCIKSNRKYLSNDIENIIKDSFMNNILDNNNDEDLDTIYSWSKGNKKSSDHFNVTTNLELNSVPDGGTFNMTKKNIMALNDEINEINMYSD